jgi:hypothetical protein
VQKIEQEIEKHNKQIKQIVENALKGDASPEQAKRVAKRVRFLDSNDAGPS